MINSNDLKGNIEEVFASAETKVTGKFNDEPDGKHTFVIQKAYFDKSRSGDVQVVWILEVKDCPDLGNTVRKYSPLQKKGINDAEKMGYLKGELKALGYEVTDIPTLELALEDLAGKVVEGETKTKNGYTNRYLNNRIGSTVVSNVKPKNTDDVPF